MSTSLKRKRASDPPAIDGVSVLQGLSTVEYDHGVLDELMQYYNEKQNTGSDDTTATLRDMYCCTRAYEESFLREPVANERACGRDHLCEGKQLTGVEGFVLREFLYPNEPASQERCLCLLCRRYEISRMFFKYETNVSSYPPSSMRISDHYNLVGIAGEYDIRDCIVSGEHYTGLPMPVVLHIRSAYSVFIKDGVKHLQQSRVRCPGTANEETTDDSGSFLRRRAELALARAAPSNKSDLAQ